MKRLILLIAFCMAASAYGAASVQTNYPLRYPIMTTDGSGGGSNSWTNLNSLVTTNNVTAGKRLTLNGVTITNWQFGTASTNYADSLAQTMTSYVNATAVTLTNYVNALGTNTTNWVSLTFAPSNWVDSTFFKAAAWTGWSNANQLIITDAVTNIVQGSGITLGRTGHVYTITATATGGGMDEDSTNWVWLTFAPSNWVNSTFAKLANTNVFTGVTNYFKDIKFQTYDIAAATNEIAIDGTFLDYVTTTPPEVIVYASGSGFDTTLTNGNRLIVVKENITNTVIEITSVDSATNVTGNEIAWGEPPGSPPAENFRRQTLIDAYTVNSGLVFPNGTQTNRGIHATTVSGLYVTDGVLTGALVASVTGGVNSIDAAIGDVTGVLWKTNLWTGGNVTGEFPILNTTFLTGDFATVTALNTATQNLFEFSTLLNPAGTNRVLRVSDGLNDAIIIGRTNGVTNLLAGMIEFHGGDTGLGSTKTPLDFVVTPRHPTNAWVGMSFATATNAAEWPYIEFLKARGTFETPALVQDGDCIGEIAGCYYDGANYRVSATIEFHHPNIDFIINEGGAFRTSLTITATGPTVNYYRPNATIKSSVQNKAADGAASFAALSKDSSISVEFGVGNASRLDALANRSFIYTVGCGPLFFNMNASASSMDIYAGGIAAGNRVAWLSNGIWNANGFAVGSTNLITYTDQKTAGIVTNGGSGYGVGGLSNLSSQFYLTEGATSSLSIHVPAGMESNAVVNRKQLYDALDQFSEETLYGATNAHAVIAGAGSLFRTSPAAWAITNALSTGTNLIGTFWLTNTTDFLREGTYVGRAYAMKSAGAPVVNTYIELVQSVDNGATTNVLGQSAVSGALGTTLASYRMTVAMNSNISASSQYIGVKYYAVKSGAAVNLITYGGSPYDTHIATPGLGTAGGYLIAETDPIHTNWVAQQRAITVLSETGIIGGKLFVDVTKPNQTITLVSNVTVNITPTGAVAGVFYGAGLSIFPTSNTTLGWVAGVNVFSAPATTNLLAGKLAEVWVQGTNTASTNYSGWVVSKP